MPPSGNHDSLINTAEVCCDTGVAATAIPRMTMYSYTCWVCHLCCHQLLAWVQAVKPGGRVVYSTCSISPLENDQVVSKALSILQDQMHISISCDSQQLLKEPCELPLEPSNASTSLGQLLLRLGAEPTEHGLLVLPDKAGSGPMYVCLLLKL